MCGICGYINREKNNFVEERVLRAMMETLKYRGPDDHGLFIDKNVGLGFRRLAIIDLVSGNQPIFNEDGTVAVVFNGEIYNFPEIRRELSSRHNFKTNTDTEVIVHLYEEMGDQLLHRLNGMFAFAIWDSKEGRFFCARDRMGQKPFYYILKNGTFAFASEPKALLLHPAVSKEIDPVSLRKYLAYEYVPSPHTIFKDIKKLPAGFKLNLGSDFSLKVERYWKPDLKPFKESFKDNSEREEFYCQRIRELLKSSVERRLISDVPLGAFLSGGIDSSSIVSFMSELMDPKDIKTFSIGFQESSFDESSYAKRVANHFGTDHKEKILDKKEMFNILIEIIEKLDEPFADASIVPTHLLSKFTREHVTVALSGDGGDELFCGYPTFQAHKLAAYYRRLPRFLHENVIKRIVERLPVSTSNMSFDFRAKQFLSGVDYAPHIRQQAWLGSFSPPSQRELLRQGREPEIEDRYIYEDIEQNMNDFEELGDMDKIIYLYTRFYLQEDILMKTDRASMFCSLEARAPFLDVELVEFVNSIPEEFKIRGFTTKYILKKAMRQNLPQGIADRPKKGFGMPVADWFKGDLNDKLRQVLSKEELNHHNFFNYPYIKNLIEDHLSGRRDNRKQLWTLFVFQVWYEKWIRQA
ncbi:MAG: asparagine synthase (glutamine-hydrolyzing) [Candidatus Omnitrophica bacterium]|nr:asparagine synthase (glutamine-hydrolyzing) [Candidatus Omnitrophota bacterium]